MTDFGRKDFSTKAEEKITPDSSKSTVDKISETFTDTSDRIFGAAQPNQDKSATQRAFDSARGETDNQAHGGSSQTIGEKTGKEIREQQPLIKKLKLLLLFNPLPEWIDTTHAMRFYMHNPAIEGGMPNSYIPILRKRLHLTHVKTKRKHPSLSSPDQRIRRLLPHQHDPIRALRSRRLPDLSEDFFSRAHGSDGRPIHEQEDLASAVVVTDSRIVAYGTVNESKGLWIKRDRFSISNLDPRAVPFAKDELGIFQYGGSSIIVAFEKGRIQFDEDLLNMSRNAITVDVQVVAFGTHCLFLPILPLASDFRLRDDTRSTCIPNGSDRRYSGGAAGSLFIVRMSSAFLRSAAEIKSRIPLLKDVHLNFIFLHYTYIIFVILLTSVIMLGGSNLAYIDALFFCAGAATQSGLNTVDFNLLFTYQQVLLYFVSMLTTPIFIHTMLVFVRLYWFEKRFQHVVRDARALRHTRSRLRTITEDKDPESYNVEENGVRNRSIVVMRSTQENTGEMPQEQSPSPDMSDSGSVSGAGKDDSVSEDEEKAQRGRLGFGLGSLRFPTQLSPDQHIAFLENQRKNTGALRIPSPREYDRGGVPQVLEDQEEIQEVPSPRTKGRDEADNRHSEEEEDQVGPLGAPHITINEPDMVRTKTRNSTFPRLDTRPTMHETKDVNDPSPLQRTTTRRPTFTSVYRSLTQERDRNTLPYLSWNATVARNSNFVDLTEEQRDELGGIEYRALKTLAVVLMSYYVLFHLLGIICLVGWIMTTHWGSAVTQIGQGRPWWAIFTAASSFNDVGFSITPDSMMSFQDAIFPLLLLTFLIVIGNTGFPCMLRLIIWMLSKLTRKESPLWEELRFLLDHPRRCFTLLFPRNATWWLFAILIALNGIDVIFFIILDLNDSTVTKLPVGIRILDGLFQAACTRTAGFSVVSLSDIHPAVQVSYLIMMYISVFPIAISLRRTNVYEEKSLGVYADQEEDDDDNQTAPSYIGTHLRRQLSFDLWYVFLGLFIITIVEGDRLQRTDQYNFQIWSVLFEVVSAYGTVGMSLGYPGSNASFASQFRTLSKLVIIAMQIRGRHRGLPYTLDRAILLPSEHLHQDEITDAERRVRRRTSSFSRMPSTDRQDNGTSSGMDHRDSILRRQSTRRSQRSQR
ncbi:potassium transport protein TRK1/TRK2 [Aspergillus affinis]|uniref:potassium transport protein TRK1/TRK2 n=1 Tax=Aspergillus affinis TaxID=1070780 RepID=UPI0022FE3B26|nr:potassium transport protein TRK1/TRK2 [Aspergillus affinis]KAI9035822.1 potassium transport protein TRK1/TRK2 [Aspergillus affinis]